MQGHIRAVEESSIIGARTFITSNVEVTITYVSGIRVNIDLDATVQGACQCAAVVIWKQVAVTRKSRGVIQNTCHGQCRSNVSRTDEDVTLSTTSLVTNRVHIAFDLEEESFELLNRPATVGINVEVKYASSCCVVLSARASNEIDGTNHFAVDLSQNLC